MTYAVYQYQPLTIRSLAYLLIHDVFGETARFQRQIANGMWAVACGKTLDFYSYRPYPETAFETVYRNPFKPVHTETGEDIVNHLLGRG